MLPTPEGAAEESRAAHIEAQLERMLASPEFAQAGSLSRFLRFVVEESLAGRADALKEYSLGVAVFDRGESFDPKLDTIVRVQARRLRAKLEKYYSGPNQADPVVIELPKGSYGPVFHFRSGTAEVPRIPRRFARRQLIAAAVAAVLIAAGAAWGLRRVAGQPSFSSIAVLPFDNLAHDPEEEWFSDGMTETLIMELSRIRGLKVISRTSVLPFKGAPRKSLKQIARELGVDAIVEGSALRVGDRVRITAQLIAADTDTHLWGNDFDGDMKDVLSLQRTVARAIAQQAGSVMLAEGAPARSADALASQLYLRGLFQANRGTEAGLKKGIELFEQTVARSPEHADAYAAMASAYTQLSSFYVPPREAMPKAKQAAQKALELNSGLSKAHTQLGLIALYYDWDWPAAEQELKRALELDPNSAEAHLLYEDYLLVEGRKEQAIAEAKTSIELDPLGVRVLLEAQFTSLTVGQYSEAVALGERIAEVEPAFGSSHAFSALAYAGQRDFPRAISEADTAVRLEPTPLNKAFQAHIRASTGDKAGALRILEELKTLNASRYVCSYEIATAYASLGDNDSAFQYLKEGLRQRADCMVWLRVEPWMKSLQSDPRFAQVTKDIGLR